MRIFKGLFLNQIFFRAMFGIIFGFCLGFFWPFFMVISQLLLFALALLCLVDLIFLFWKKEIISGSREVNDKLSNFDENLVQIHLKNHLNFKVSLSIFEEIPAQFQLFDFKITGEISAHKERTFKYVLEPKTRGIYGFGKTIVMVQSPLKLLERKVVLSTEKQIKVYPSFLRLNQFNLKNFNYSTEQFGQKKLRRVGHSMEFEQIKNYVRGDDMRTINWKSTAKHQKLMVNQYVDEKAQQIYCVVDKGRLMKMPFEEKTLLDYSLNASLILANIVLQNHDRVGFFTFSKQLENVVKAERRTTQLQKIQESLYNVQTDFQESDFGKLYTQIKHQITQRSLLVLFTNFDSMDALHRQLPYLMGINRSHLLLVVFFRNTEMENRLQVEVEEDLYERAIIEKFLYEKQQIVLELRKHGIQAVLSHPDDLIVNTINKYLEIKSRGIL